MTEARRQAYLNALGFDVWKARPGAADRGRLLVSARASNDAAGSILLITDETDRQSSSLAGDIERTLGGGACWAWPDPECSADNPKLDEAISTWLFTEVVIFGDHLPAQLAITGTDGALPAVIGSARISVVASLEELAASGLARQALWTAVLRDRLH